MCQIYSLRVRGSGSSAEHPDTLDSKLRRLYILHDLGMMEQLQDLLRVVLPAHEKVLSRPSRYSGAAQK
jgi:hypothetical protein